ncbi:MAG: zinc-ribbon domain-containing protein [Bacteroidales bacterium]|nr:zinc-ribbon domain-containing protein [Bacteroidales bacterium]
MKYCKKCGKEFDDSMQFCTHCGGSLEQKATGQEATVQEASGDRPKPKPKLSKIIVVLAAALIVVFVVHNRIEEQKNKLKLISQI